MLKTVKSTTLTGQSQIEVDGKMVTAVQMTANISGQANTSENMTVVNKDLYEANIVECRSDMDAFREAYRAIEDSEN